MSLDASKKIDKQISSLKDWRGEEMSKIRRVIHSADPKIVEEWKWNTGVWTHDGMVLSLGAFKDHVKVNFFKGAALKDPHKIFNAGLDAKETRGIDIHRGDKVDEIALKELIQAAVAFNTTKK